MASKNTRSCKKAGGNVRVNSKTPGRPKPVIAKAGYTQTRRRFGNGGELCW